MSETLEGSDGKIAVEPNLPPIKWIVYPFGEPKNTKHATICIKVPKELRFFHRLMLRLIFGFTIFRPEEKK